MYRIMIAGNGQSALCFACVSLVKKKVSSFAAFIVIVVVVVVVVVVVATDAIVIDI
jgi:hypothetical protein